MLERLGILNVDIKKLYVYFVVVKDMDCNIIKCLIEYVKFKLN